MAIKKTAPEEPVNSEQVEAQEAAQAAETTAAVATGPTAGELEERAVMAEERADAAEAQVISVVEEMLILKEQIAQLMRAQRVAGVARSAPIAAGPTGDHRDGDPVFNEEEPHGIVVGDPVIAYVQNGHQFARDRRYVATEEHRGSPRTFNPRLIGVTKPRPGLQAADPLADFRDDPRRAA